MARNGRKHHSLISGEEEKSEQEPLKVFGHIENGEIVKAEGPIISAQCIRVPVLNGHTATVSISFNKKPTKEELIDRLNNFKGQPQEFKLPHALNILLDTWKKKTVHRLH